MVLGTRCGAEWLTMGQDSKIEWTHHTFNPWWGCTKVSPACDHCYAERDAKRFSPDMNLWGVGARRRTFGDGHWNDPVKWNARAAREGRRERVFCASMADVFDNEGPEYARVRLWKLIEATPSLDWLMLTKRAGNVSSMVPVMWWEHGFPSNVWLGISVVNQHEADRDVRRLLLVPARVRFLSCEPLLGPINLQRAHRAPERLPRVSWVIVGGESGPNARPMHPDWVRSIRDECEGVGVPFLFKQWGEWAPGECADGPPSRTERTATYCNGEWTFERVTPRESEETHRDDEPDLFRLGRRAAGRMLDGRTWDEYPQEVA